MPAILFFLLFATQVTSSGNDKHLAPEEARKSSFEISPKAIEAIQPLDGRSLASDPEFVRRLREVLENPNFDDADKADAFFLMRMKFDWVFLGAVMIPPGYSYDRIFGMYLKTYRDYGKALEYGSDVSGLLQVAKRSEPENIIRSSSALLLAAVLDPEATRETVIVLSDPDRIADSVAPPIVIHHLALCAALCNVGDEGFTQLAALMSRSPYEESQEDILLALAYTDSPHNRTLIEKFAEEYAPKKFDIAVQLALSIMRSRQKPEVFKLTIDQITAKCESDQVKQSILDWSQAALRPVGPFHPQRGIMKVWDGFTATLYNDGSRLTFGDQFSGFMSR
jgi:hypothetical protein